MNFDPITYNEAAQLRAHFLLLNGDPAVLRYLIGPGITGGDLQTWLANPANLTAFQQLLSAPAGAAAIFASGTAMAAVVASSTAMAAVAASSTAMAAVIASSTAMAAVAASSTAMAAVIASQPALSQIRQSATALSAINASNTALDALYATATKFNWVGGGNSANPATLVTGNFLLVRITSKGSQEGWVEGSMTGGQYVKINGALFTTTSGSNNGASNISSRAANPFVQDKAARAVNGTTITYYTINALEIAYLAA